MRPLAEEPHFPQVPGFLPLLPHLPTCASEKASTALQPKKGPVILGNKSGLSDFYFFVSPNVITFQLYFKSFPEMNSTSGTEMTESPEDDRDLAAGASRNIKLITPYLQHVPSAEC